MTPVETSLLRRAMGFVRAALGLKQVVQGATLIGVGLLVIFGWRLHAMLWVASCCCTARS